jgi:hypothetical protein
MLGTLNVSIGCRSVAGVRGQRNSEGSAGRHGKGEVSTGWRIIIFVRKSKLRMYVHKATLSAVNGVELLATGRHVTCSECACAN